MKIDHSAFKVPYRQVIREIIAKLSPFDEIEKTHQMDALKWIESSEPLCRIEKPITPPKHLVAYCLVIDMKQQKLLLGDHLNLSFLKEREVQLPRIYVLDFLLPQLTKMSGY